MKKLMLICAPVSSRSGYGDPARALVRAFIKLEILFSVLFDASPIFWLVFNKLVIAIANLFGRKSDKTFEVIH